MTTKSARLAIKDALEDLTEKKLKKFRAALLDRRGEPRVKTNAVDGKDLLTITDVLVSTFTSGALQVTVELLTEIGCNEEAKKLGEFTQHERKHTPVISVSKRKGSSSSAVSAEDISTHFVDQHRTTLIERVSNPMVILDKLLMRMAAKPTPQDKMRVIFSFLRLPGTKGKDALYQILKEDYRSLVSDLERSS
uniref:Pyrin domain-containing protein n=1 Tax=Myripristis murdjan TaxID=586833 RepID=A0A667X4A3_9TELE